jgi:hypothetical protein
MNGYPTRPKQPKSVKQLDLVGTAEAAEILGVERPRIGRWINRGVMPPTAVQLQATPVWYKRDIVKMLPWVESNRRQRKTEAQAQAKAKQREAVALKRRKAAAAKREARKAAA